MPIYDVKAKQEDLKTFLNNILQKIEEDKITGMLLIYMDKENEMYQIQSIGEESNIFEWIGALEVSKTNFIDGLLE